MAERWRYALGLLGKFFRAVRERWAVLTVIILGICVPVYSMAWWLDVLDNVQSTIAITALVTMWPFAKLALPHEPLKVLSLETLYSVAFVFMLAVGIGNRYDLQIISFSAIAILLALPWCWVVGVAVRRETMLLAGFLPALVATMTYWIAGLVDNNISFDLSLLPLPVVFIGGAIWAPLALLMLQFARRHKDGKISGPGTQVMTMTTLFFPITLVAVVLPPDLGLSSIWSNVSLALIGLFLSGVISEPLRRMLIEWGKLAPRKTDVTIK